MPRILSTLFLFAWAFWLGGIFFLFFAVSALFAQSHATGAAAAPAIFLCFEKYHLAFAGISLILCAMLMETPPRRARRWIFALVMIGCITALISSQFLTPRINALHLAGLANTPAFRHLHGLSFTVYLAETLALLITGFLLASTGPAPR